MIEHNLFVEKYRPKELKDFIGNEELINQLDEFLSNENIINLLFYGPPGCGKTTLAKIIVNKLNCDFIYINSSDEKGIDTIREKVQGFASSASFYPLKIIILDEADYLTMPAQAALRNIIETFSHNVRFILTGNYIERIIEALQSRCTPIKIIPPSKKLVAKHVANILDLENISYDINDLALIVNKFFPDLRKILNTVQLFSKENKLKINNSILVASSYIKEVILELSKPKPNWLFIRQIIADSGVNDFEELFRTLYDESSKFLPGKEGSATILINETLYQANFRIDKEINCLSLIANLIQLKK